MWLIHKQKRKEIIITGVCCDIVYTGMCVIPTQHTYVKLHVQHTHPVQHLVCIGRAKAICFKIVKNDSFLHLKTIKGTLLQIVLPY